MGWAKNYIDKLNAGEVVRFRPKGNSMLPLIKSGELCTVVPTHGLAGAYVTKDDIVLCKVNGNEYLHKVLAVKIHLKLTEIDAAVKSGRPNDKNEFQIGNNKGHVNGWIKGTHIYGKLIKVEP